MNAFRYREDLLPASEFKGDYIYSPYRTGKKSWKKIALHLHSSEVFFSQFRHTPEEIYRGYKSAGDYSGIVITDYMKITSVRNLQGWTLPGYEWGCNPKKK
ncbi:MAG TPA: phosphoesterase, partial [Leptospiraceae bacterium]|nr:phosphoesterase [Leptospiraceae bacterium]